jgi:hypothetical protein
MKKVVIYLIVFIIAAIGFDVSAAPDISSVSTATSISHGQRITISGTEFGSNESGGPLVWDDFENGTGKIVGKSPKIENLPGDWVWSQTHESPVYTTAKVRGKSTKSSLHSFKDHYNCGLRVATKQLQYYFTFLLQYDKISTNWSRNTKPWIIYGSGPDYTPIAYTGWGQVGFDPMLRNNIIDYGNVLGNTIWGGPNIDQIEGKWVRVEVWVKQSSPSKENGLFQMWVHRPTEGSSVIRLELSDKNYCTRGTQNVWEELEIMSYSAIDNNNKSQAFVDDFYLDNSPARVELGNAPIWNNCTHREIQLPDNWSTNNISIKLNQGTFQDGQKAYLFVVNSNNVASQGYEIKIGGSGSSNSSPNPPTGLKILQ